MYSRSAPRKVADDSDLYAAALRALMRRAYSIHEMKQYLERRATDKTGVTVVIMKLQQMSYLDDAKYARDYARLHANSRRQGRFRIARELRARGVPDGEIDAALDSVFAETDETALVRTRIERKLASLRGRANSPIDQKKLASLSRSLMAAGFSADLIRKEIQTATKIDSPDAVIEEAE
jgi:regulatory protein